MRVVLDVNIWISALLWGGLPAQFLHLSRQNKITIFVSESLLEELEITLQRAKFKNQLKKQNHTIEYLMAITEGFSEKCPTIDINLPQLRDPKDNHILATALSANAEVLITGDQDLLVLNNFMGIAIIKPTDFLELYFP
ncbi:MAG: putative toxin-antitoxin system toxin component, PIN family [Oscillatoriales cyanobacterium CG2_30_40_61]|nr:MAG: putative toxin-antitoxin system toxin component, PIN family [Oscillatoriales cyanobacterium CG2_30_40_61]